MTDTIILTFVIAVLFFAVRSTIKKVRDKGSCCSSGTYKAKQKKLDAIVAKKTFQVDGMSCQHCVNRVMEAVNDIDGASASVNLKKGVVTVSMEKPIDSITLKNAIEKAGYSVKNSFE